MQRMDRLRRSLRDSFRRKKDTGGPESAKPHQWQADEEAVRAGNCTFHVKYLGCVEVFESRGMQVCEEAMKVLRASRRRPVKANLYVTGDGLRVVEDDTKGLIVDQTIEKVSFCAPDRNHERGFSYICRDGTTRRWMCHGFLATKDSGERLSHAVGCAFAVCLERKQKREKECGVTMTYDSKTSTFTRSGSFRVSSMTESGGKSPSSTSMSTSMGDVLGGRPPVAPTPTPTHAIERPHAPPKMLERQGSFRGFSQLSNHSPFKRQHSLRLNELPSNLQRTQQNALNIFGNSISSNNNSSIPPPPVSASPAPPPRTQRNRLHSLPTGTFAGGTIPEVSSTSNTSSEISLNSLNNGMKVENKDLVSELCQQVTQGLSLLAANHEESSKPPNGFTMTSNKNKLNMNSSSVGFGSSNSSSNNTIPKFNTNPWDDEVDGTTPSKISALPIFNTSSLVGSNNSSIMKSSTKDWTNNLTQNHEPKNLPPKISPIKENIPIKSASLQQRHNNINQGPTPTSTTNASITTTTTTPHGHVPAGTNQLSGGNKVQQLNSMNRPMMQRGGVGVGPTRSQSLGADPFDADWAAPLARNGQTPTNPFNRQQTFQVSM